MNERPTADNGADPVREEPRPSFASLVGHQYMNLMTFRKDGRAVRTPVWFADDSSNGEVYVYTMGDSGKVKRIRNNGSVLVGPSDRRGRPLGPEEPGVARILPPAAGASAEKTLNRKYGLQKRAFGLAMKALGKAEGIVYLGISSTPGGANAAGTTESTAGRPEDGS